MPTSTLPASAYEALELPTDTITVSTKPKPTQTPTSSIASLNLLQHEPAPAPPLAPNESAITLYVESLLHIRTVTLYASLHTSHTRETKAQLAADGGSITVSHEGESATVRLPIKAQGGGDATLLLPPQPPSKDLTLRLQIEEVEGMNFLGGAQAERKVNVVPWDGVSLNTMQEVEFVCRACERVLLKKGTIREWRDLPNENWAEMMDFWHCHKPDEHHLYGHNHAAQKSYAAGNRLQAIAGIGFVDLASLLLKEQDCEGVQVGQAVCLPSFPLSVPLFTSFCIVLCASGCKEGDLSLVYGRIVDISTLNEYPPHTSLQHVRATSSFALMGAPGCQVVRPGIPSPLSLLKGN